MLTYSLELVVKSHTVQYKVPIWQSQHAMSVYAQVGIKFSICHTNKTLNLKKKRRKHKNKENCSSEKNHGILYLQPPTEICRIWLFTPRKNCHLSLCFVMLTVKQLRAMNPVWSICSGMFSQKVPQQWERKC